MLRSWELMNGKSVMTFQSPTHVYKNARHTLDEVLTRFVLPFASSHVRNPTMVSLFLDPGEWMTRRVADIDCSDIWLELSGMSSRGRMRRRSGVRNVYLL